MNGELNIKLNIMKTITRILKGNDKGAVAQLIFMVLPLLLIVAYGIIGALFYAAQTYLL